MATGDLADIKARIAQLLPNGWFGDSNSVRDSTLSGIAWALSLVYQLAAYARIQTRIRTATDGFLDLISFDFFGAALPRGLQEFDAPFRARILAALFPLRATRQGMIGVLTMLTGRAPWIFEPARPADTGAYGVSTSGYGVAGGYGSLRMAAQAFVVAYRPLGQGIPFIAGYGSPEGAYSTPSQTEYASLSLIQGAVTDAAIFAAIDATKVAGTAVWARISS